VRRTTRDLPLNLVARLVRSALQEDLGAGDLTSRLVVPHGMQARGTITAGRPLVLAGLEPARLAFLQTDPQAAFPCASDAGATIAAGGIVLEVEGSAAAILAAERTALNFLARLSGIATWTRRFVEAVEGTGAEVYDTRKTTPGLRLLEKEAVALGGGRSHRMGLHDAVLIKDNHLACSGGVGAAVRLARTGSGPGIVIEVEVETIEQLEEAVQAGADILLLDNMSSEMVAEAVRRVRGRARIEVSGGITLENIHSFARAGVDRISVGALTHSAPAADVSLSLLPIEGPGAGR